MARSERLERWHGRSAGRQCRSERWRSSFFASHSHVATHSFFKNWMLWDRWHTESGESGESAVRGGAVLN